MKTSPRNAAVLAYAEQCRARIVAACTPSEVRRLAIAFSRLPSQVRALVRPTLVRVQAGVRQAWEANTLGEYLSSIDALQAELTAKPATVAPAPVVEVPTLATLAAMASVMAAAMTPAVPRTETVWTMPRASLNARRAAQHLDTVRRNALRDMIAADAMAEGS